MEDFKATSLESKSPEGMSGDMPMTHSTPEQTTEHLSAMDRNELDE